MSKFQRGDKVKVVKHPKPEYLGLEGKVTDVREGIKGVTQPVPDGGSLPQLGKQYKYDVYVGPQAAGSGTLLDLAEDWLESSG